jgi:uncharacterized protein
MNSISMFTLSHMKKLVFLSLLALVLLTAPLGSLAQQSFPDKPKGIVNDFANVIPAAYKQQITAVAAELENKTGVEISIVTMSNLGGNNPADFANRLFAKWGIGKKGEDNGILLLFAQKERQIGFETGYGVEGVLPDGKVGEILDLYVVPYFKQDRFGDGFLNGTLAVSQIIADEAGVTLTGQSQVPVRAPQRRRSPFSLLPLILIIFLMFGSRRRTGSWIFFLPLLLGGGGLGPRSRGGFGGSFGGFGGGFGGFGGGMSGGGGAWRGF